MSENGEGTPEDPLVNLTAAILTLATRVRELNDNLRDEVDNRVGGAEMEIDDIKTRLDALEGSGE